MAKKDIERWLTAVRRSSLSATARLVAWELSAYLDWSSLDNAYPGPSRLARRLNLSPRTARRALIELCDAGWLTKHYRAGPSPQRPSAYALHWPTRVTGDTTGRDTGDTQPNEGD